MKRKATIVKLAIFTAAMLLILFGLVTVFGDMRFDSKSAYHADFTSASNLKTNEFVRIAGVEVGKVNSVEVVDNSTARVTFSLYKGVAITDTTRAAVRFANLIGDRYLELLPGSTPGIALPADATLPLDRTAPALDLDALIGGFRPLLRAMNPDEVNRISTQLVSVLQGQGGNIAAILGQTAQFTKTLADRDQLIGSVIDNLNTVLGTVDERRKEFDHGIDQLQQLISGLAQQADPIAASLAHLSDVSGSVESLLADGRPDIKSSIAELGRVAGTVDADKDYVNRLLTELPDTYQRLSRLGLAGDFFSFYLCDAQLKLNGPNGNPVYIPLVGQRAGRCTPS